MRWMLGAKLEDRIKKLDNRKNYKNNLRAVHVESCKRRGWVRIPQGQNTSDEGIG